jgi:hypothetical protein
VKVRKNGTLRSACSRQEPMGAAVFEPLTHVIRGVTERFADAAQSG